MYRRMACVSVIILYELERNVEQNQHVVSFLFLLIQPPYHSICSNRGMKSWRVGSVEYYSCHILCKEKKEQVIHFRYSLRPGLIESKVHFTRIKKNI